ncbi:hypothetical protein DKM44_08185 [Deinococcus irradiatisoli]|uniref:Adhesin domain-containing protein n=1 Tax=Deinococcus irradiatisoli TaxID=2202254 RepID=A0A2Z3JGT7_9DEIO|nr:hypothetical protein [Deinococcus irradiatisoli]AWN23206.1 hypothetical protein DKM44_08185 [Deinococcus irradiatisoli]
MTQQRPRTTPFPHWSLPAALLRISITIGLLTALIVAFFASLERRDVGQLAAGSVAVLTAPVGAAQRLNLTVAPNTSHTLQLRAAPDFTARLTASRRGDLRLTPRPSPAGERRWTLSRAVQGLPVLIQLDAQSGLPGALSLDVPGRVPLTLSLSRSADDTDLDLREVQLERLNVAASGGQLRATLPLRGQARLSLSGSGSRAALRLPPGTARLTLDARLSGGSLSLTLPPGAQVQLDVRSSGAPIPAPPGFEVSTLPDRRTRRYVQVGRAGGPRLSATLNLTDTTLILQGDLP